MQNSIVMNTAQWHLLLNHLPIIGTVIGTLIMSAGFILKNNSTVKVTALGVFVFSALCAIPAYLTGEGAEEVVEKLPGVTKSLIESHEDLGQIFFIVAGALGVLSVVTFLADWRKNKMAAVLYVIVLIAGIGLSVFAKQVGTSGGEVRHSEIRNNSAQQLINGTEQNNESKNGDD